MGEKKRELIDVDTLRHSLYYARPDHPATERALRLVGCLQEFLEVQLGGNIPVVAMTLTTTQIFIEIGHFVVWSSEEDGEENLELADCIAKYQDEVRKLSTILEPDAVPHD